MPQILKISQQFRINPVPGLKWLAAVLERQRRRRTDVLVPVRIGSIQTLILLQQGVLPHHLHRYTFSRIHLQHSPDKIFCVSRQAFGENVDSLQNFVYDLSPVTITVERKTSSQHREKNDTAGPDIGSVSSVVLALDHFRRGVVRATA